jgi:Ca2+/Na+ antiporter
MMFHPTIDEYDQVEEQTCCKAFSQLVAMPWKMVFATIPPKKIGGGWISFLVCAAWICFLTFCCAELIENIVCLLNFNNCIAGLILVSIGCAIPEIVTSVSAASDKTRANCDDVFLPVVASNSANIFIGLGLPWTIAAIHRYVNDDGPIYLGKYEAFDVFFVTITFVVGSLLAFLIFGCRRGCLNVDIGGSHFSRFCSSCMLFTIWITFVLLNILNCYGFFGETFMPW